MSCNKLLTGSALAGFLVAAAGCTTLGKALANRPVPGYGINDKAASEVGCDLQDIKTRAEQYKKQSYDQGGPGYVVPSVGDSVCDVFAKLGRPDDLETITTEFGGALNFWYRTGSTETYDLKMHLVVLEQDESGNRLVVTSVVW